tara:strand:- start:200 stop:379 length:180 start_codon:yes stop_codon:yes gene_type:complete
MADIRTTAEEFSTSGSLLSIETKTFSSEDYTDIIIYKSIKFLQKKIDELTTEVNILKNK